MEAYISKKSYAAYLEYGFPVFQFLQDHACLERLRRSFTTRTRTCGKLYDIRGNVRPLSLTWLWVRVSIIPPA